MVKQKDPVWEEWLDLGKASDGKKYAKCKFCDHRLQVNSTRFKSHVVVSCPNSPETVKYKYRADVAQQSLATPKQKEILVRKAPQINTEHAPTVCPTTFDSVAESNPIRSHTSVLDTTQMPGTSSVYENPGAVVEPSAKRVCQPEIAGFMDRISVPDKLELDQLWAETLYSNNWSFNSVHCPSLVEFVRKLRPSYKLPSAYQSSHGLLDTVASKIEQTNRLAFSRASNLTVMLDGWTDVNNTSLVNVAIYAGISIL